MTIKHVAKLVKEFAKWIGLLYLIGRCPDKRKAREVILFPPVPVLKVVMKATGLYERAKV